MNTPSSVTVPVSVTIGAGVTTATFAVTAIEDANSVNETVSVGVNAGGYGVQTVVVNVTDNDADYFSRRSGSHELDQGGASGTATVYLSQPAGAGGQVVTLSSSNSSVTVPTSVSGRRRDHGHLRGNGD